MVTSYITIIIICNNNNNNKPTYNVKCLIIASIMLRTYVNKSLNGFLRVCYGPVRHHFLEIK